MKNDHPKINRIRDLLQQALCKVNGGGLAPVIVEDISAVEFDEIEDLVTDAMAACFDVEDSDLGIKTDGNGEVLQ